MNSNNAPNREMVSVDSDEEDFDHVFPKIIPGLPNPLSMPSISSLKADLDPKFNQST